MHWLTKSRVVVDTNIFVSALLRGGVPAKVLQFCIDKDIKFLLSPILGAEILKTTQRFEYPPEKQERLKYILETHTEKISPTSSLTICRDQDDNKILALAIDGKADYIITGDNDLLALGNLQGIPIVKPKDFLALVKRKNK